MHRFFEKYAKSIRDKDAVKLIVNKVEEAYKECKEGDDDYIGTLEEVVAMVNDLKQIKGH